MTTTFCASAHCGRWSASLLTNVPLQSDEGAAYAMSLALANRSCSWRRSRERAETFALLMSTARSYWIPRSRTPSVRKPFNRWFQMRRSPVAVFLVFVAASPVLGQSMTDRIRSLRDQSNAAIARHDVDGVLSLLDAEYQITTGSGTLGQGRAGERDAWTVEFARASDLVYVRTPASIEVSSSGDRAAETGSWKGSWSTPAGLRKSGGRYAAYWRLVDGNWRIRSELFVTLTCEGPGCS